MIQQEYLGKNSIKYIKDILNLVNPKKIFLITGNKSYNSSGARKILEDLFDTYTVIHFQISTKYLKLNELIDGLKIFEKDCDLVIAVGGGSVIDAAKSINIFSTQDRESIEYLIKNNKISKNGLPLIAIPTTTGTGSEATHFAVIYVNGVKYSLSHDFLLPTYAIIDPNLTMSMSKNIAANSGMDAFCQAIESYWSVNSTEESKSYSKRSIKLILKNFIESVNNPSLELREAMAEAANLAGKAINITKTTVSHALSYYITSNFGIPHGQAVALTIGSALEYNAKTTNQDCNDKRGPAYVIEIINNLCSILGASSPKEAKVIIESIARNIDIETDIKKLGINLKELEEIVNNINYERINNNPRKFKDKEALKSLFKSSHY